MTGSGKTAAFLLPIPEPAARQAARHDARTGTHANPCELAAQILEELNQIATHTPISAAVGIWRRGNGAAGACVSAAVST